MRLSFRMIKYSRISLNTVEWLIVRQAGSIDMPTLTYNIFAIAIATNRTNKTKYGRPARPLSSLPNLGVYSKKQPKIFIAQV